jgi:hypothetical protein
MLSKERLNELFIHACAEGNLNAVVELYENYYLIPNLFLTKFISFFFIIDSVTEFNPHAHNNEAFLKACSNGQTKVVHFLLNNKKFVKEISETESLSEGFAIAVGLGHVNMAKNIMHFINKYQKNLDYFYNAFIKGFASACRYGKEKSVDYMLKNFPQSLQIQLSNKSSSMSLITYGFMHACEHGQTKVIDTFATNSRILPVTNFGLGFAVAIEKNMLNIVKHIMGTSIFKKHINLEKLPSLKVPDVEMMNYLMYSLNFKDKPGLMDKLNCDFNILLAEKMEIHKELNSELKNIDMVEEKSKKKLKI